MTIRQDNRCCVGARNRRDVRLITVGREEITRSEALNDISAYTLKLILRCKECKEIMNVIIQILRRNQIPESAACWL